jgi:hypothetical protein
MRIKKLRKKIRRQARRDFRAGNITRQQFWHCVAVSESSDAVLQKLNSRIENEVNPWNRADGLIGADWKGWLSNAWDWFAANWEAILLLVLRISPLLLLSPREND